MAQTIPMEQLEQQVATGLLTLHIDSRKVKQGDVFVALPGATVDGGKFIENAIENGAAYIVCSEENIPANPVDAVFVVTENTKETLGRLASARFGTANLNLQLVGVTGTNGKTTVTSILEYLFAEAGRKTGVIGTVAYRWPGTEIVANMTTPDCLKLHSLLSRMEAAGVENAFMEVSSHALDQNRTAGIRFAGGVLTNVTQDHLDYHGDMETYFDAKKKLFTTVPDVAKLGVVNLDDAYGKRLLPELSNGIGFTLTGADVEGCRVLRGEILESTVDGLKLHMSFEGQEWNITSPMVGTHNASNLLAAMAVGVGMGLTIQQMQSLSGYTGVCGRLERIPTTKGIYAFVDYAHTPDALVNVLSALRKTGFERIITVFGCGGDRDRTKRPLMGEAVAKGTDVAVLTSDNPRTENPDAILEDVKPGLADCKEVLVEVDRKKAIELAVSIAKPGDCILVAGKGHEDYQVLGTKKVPFSDQAILKELL
ncbi:UDP-N-acetylmuramoyl-L-alanyl-D-glutamate--2,6-diaminopimelate ligase [Halodesulfovibrio sp.]|uniref:UDP-N-acetylmuramoyl-L-alanyl-D-glutamate--2, 6-diaminopimelate ligase n=1 Tax=Halodesulfovibrio sp. TaxID=1912772 RepID=UPI0025F881AD|nr:UDP-N-acetylmuramoyl-L-alanyl-D-glutamate--2,6-diaminopimelate ligase [Halodesulfovibrio sp.]MCT4626328.1 UDP-N-acetylmuramoyl-L-alanyl-D-glutamate--2,6-diaminopimelate ligase [Halodesulfovibrio sp.]